MWQKARDRSLAPASHLDTTCLHTEGGTYMYHLTMCSSSCGVCRCSGHVSNGARWQMSEACRNMYTCTGQKNGNVRVPSRPGMSGPAGLVTLSWVRRDHSPVCKVEGRYMYVPDVLVDRLDFFIRCPGGSDPYRPTQTTTAASFYLQYFRLSVCFIPKDRHLAGELQTLYLVIYRMPVITAAGRRSKLCAGEVSAQSFPWAARGPSNQAE